MAQLIYKTPKNYKHPNKLNEIISVRMQCGSTFHIQGNDFLRDVPKYRKARMMRNDLETYITSNVSNRIKNKFGEQVFAEDKLWKEFWQK